jgi:hypothetical protein
MRYLRQESGTYYCQLLTCVNARTFYGMKNPDYFGKNRNKWDNLIQECGCNSGPPVVAFGYIAHLFGLYYFPVVPTLENVKSHLKKGRCISITSMVEAYHAYLIIKSKGDSLTCVNYHMSKGRTVSRMKWRDMEFKGILCDYSEYRKPSALWAHLRVLLPKNLVTSDIIVEAAIERQKLLKAVDLQAYERGKVFGSQTK